MVAAKAIEPTIHDSVWTDRRNFLKREASDHIGPYPDNQFAADYQGFVESLIPVMAARTIRAWHYTRLTDTEVSIILAEGVKTSSLEFLRKRLDDQVAAGTFSSTIADALFAASPYHHPEQVEGRIGKFWMVSHPQEIEDWGIDPLLKYWGGESVYFWLKNRGLEKTIQAIAKPRVLEMAVPLASTRHSYPAAEAVVAAYGRSIGCMPDKGVFDLYAIHPLGPDAVSTVHTARQRKFQKMARGYPERFKYQSR